MAIPIAKVALLGFGGATTASGAYLMFKPESDSDDTTFSHFYDSMRDSIVSEQDREELKQMEAEVQKGIKENQSRFSHATLWLLEKENYKTIFKEIANVVNKKEPWGENVQKLKNKLNELVEAVKKDKTESQRVGLSEDKIASKALSADLENMNAKLEELRTHCGSASNSPKTMDCNLEDLFLPTNELLKNWKDKEQGESLNKVTSSETTTEIK